MPIPSAADPGVRRLLNRLGSRTAEADGGHEPAQAGAPGGVLRFDGWDIEPATRQLRVHGQPVKLGGRAFDLLAALAANPGRVIGKRALLDAAWPGLVVEENNLAVQVATLRKLLGVQAIVNVAGAGYQLTTPALPNAPGQRNDPPPHPTQPGGQTAAWRSPGALFGRDKELHKLQPVLGAVPLLTLTGPGGVGKTALAQALLAADARLWPDGVHWLDLATLRSGTSLLPLLSRTLGVVVDPTTAGTDGPGSNALLEALATRQALVVLDNCEHLLDAVGELLSPLLRMGANGLRWLATSQEALHLNGETVWRLAPLEVPEPDADLATAQRCGAFALLCARASRLDRPFAPCGDQLPMAIALCAQLDGLPLAIEMAAARLAALGLAAVSKQLAQRLRLQNSRRDAPERHHTLRQTYAWTIGLLTPAEQWVFRRLEPFVDGFSPAQAAELCAISGDGLTAIDTWDTLDALSALVDKSLVHPVAHPEATSERLRLLESARDVAQLLLREAGEFEANRQRHAQVFARQARADAEALDDCTDRQWLARVLPDQENFLAAFDWVCDTSGPADHTAALSAVLSQLDTLLLRSSRVLERRLPLRALDRASVDIRARAKLELAWSCYLDGDRAVGTDLALQALADFRALGDRAGEHLALVRAHRLCQERPGQQAQAQALAKALPRMPPDTGPLRNQLFHRAAFGLPDALDERLATLRALARQAERSGLDAQAAICRLRITDELLVSGRLQDAASSAEAELQAAGTASRIQALQQLNLAIAWALLGRTGPAHRAVRAAVRAMPGYSHLALVIAARICAAEGRLEDAVCLASHAQHLKLSRAWRDDPSEATLMAATRQAIASGLTARQVRALEREAAQMRLSDCLVLAGLDPVQ